MTDDGVMGVHMINVGVGERIMAESDTDLTAASELIGVSGEGSPG